MTLLDLAFIVILVVFAAGGMDAGLMRQLLTLFGLCAGVVLGLFFSSRVANYLASSVHILILVQPLVFLAMVLLCIGAAALLGVLWQRRHTKEEAVAWYDGLGGALLGLLGGWVALSLASVGAVWLSPSIQVELERTWLGPSLLFVGHYLVTLSRW